MASDTVDSHNAPTVLHIRTDCVEEYQQILASTHAPVSAEAHPSSPFDSSSAVILSEGICFSRTRSSHITLDFHDTFDGYGLTLHRDALFSVTHGKSRTTAAPAGYGLVVDSKSVRRAVMRSDDDLERVAVRTVDMHRRLSDLIDRPVIKRLEFSPLVSLEAPAALTALNLMNLLYEGVDGKSLILKYPAALASLRELVLNLILEGMPHSYSDLLGGHAHSIGSKAVRRASDHMRHHASQPLTIADIAQAANCSVRSLQAGFLKFKGMSPMAYLKLVRLEGVRAELSGHGGDKRISDIAHAWGFSHLSAFSAMYRNAFGETPSETQKRARRP